MTPAADRFPREYWPPNLLPAIAGCLAVLIAGALTLLAYDLGTQSGHMAIHILAMNIAAPVAAVALAVRIPAVIGQPRTLWFAAVAQLLLLWGWHVPSMQQAATTSHAMHIIMQATLFVSAFLFWSAISSLPATRRWQGIPALLLTGKLACLLSALMIFSPRALYDIVSHGNMHLDDQQLAGLLMITACPLSYLVAAVVIAAQLIGGLSEAPKARTVSPAG